MVLWEYTELFFITALTFTILAFHNSVNRIGKSFYLMGGGMLWGIIGWTLQDIDFVWGGSINIIEYTYMPLGWEAVFPSVFGWIGTIMFLLGVLIAFFEPLEILYQWLTGKSMGKIWEAK
jgi:hypothetical protein